jgi:hypothetical protein
MTTAKEAIVHSLKTSQFLLHRYVDDLKPKELLHRPATAANCAAWTIGHLTLSDRHAAQALGATDLPALPEGFETRFGRAEGAPAALEFGDTSGLMACFETNRNALIRAVEQASPEQLAKPLDRPFPIFRTAGELANFMGTHVAMHSGQITIIRRSLGYPPIV